MRTIVQLSDLHFGRTDPAVLQPLIDVVHGLSPDLLVVSGDLTQRAKSEEYKEARAYLDRLPQPQIVVPGNHDIPLYNPFKRFFSPLKNYTRYITDDLQPEFIDDEIAVVGVNTARSLTFKDGRINHEQIANVKAAFAGLEEKVTRIIVTHHPFDLPETYDESDLVGRRQAAMDAFSQCGADVLMAGHLHVSHAGNTDSRYKIKGYAALVVQAGTATSTRGRGETNSFNVLRSTDTAVDIERYGWMPESGRFEPVSVERFEYADGRWVQSPAGARL